jgi:hypothetical protein
VIVVSNSSPLIGLAKGEQFHVLQSLFEQVLIPPSVKIEIVDRGRGRHGEAELKAALTSRWILIRHPKKGTIRRLPKHWNEADKTVLALALDETADCLLVDDARLRNYALRQGIACLRTTDILLLGWLAGEVQNPKSTMNLMRARGFGISDTVYETLLQIVGISP